MPVMPAVCDSCGAMFPSGFEFENSTNITLSNITISSCLRCGGTGRIPDGTYNFTKDTIELLQGPERTVSDLERLAQILREAHERKASVEEVKETIQQETPQLSTLADLLPRTRNELYAFLGLVLSAITLIVSTANAQGINIQNVDIDINHIIGVTVEQQIQ